MNSEFEELATELMIQVRKDDSTALRVLVLENESFEQSLVLIPGYASLVSAWDELLNVAKERYNIVVIETPEKKSSKICKKTRLDVDAVAEYISEVINYLMLKDYCIVTSSISSTFIFRALSRGLISPAVSFFVGPIDRFILPSWSWPFIYLGTRVGYYVFLKPFAKLIAKMKYIKKDQKEQLHKYYGYLDSLDPIKIKRSLIALKPCRISPEELNSIKSKCVIIGASKDGLHKVELTKFIHKNIPESFYFDLETNIAAHGTKLFEKIIRFFPDKSK